MPRQRHNAQHTRASMTLQTASWMNGDWTKAGFIQQVTVLLFGALKTAGPRAERVQIAHRLSPVLGAGGRFGHHSFHQQQRSIFRQGAMAVLENHRTAFIVPIVNDAFEDDGVSEVWNGLEEIASRETRAVTDASPFQMTGRGVFASGQIENDSPDMRIFPGHGPDKFAGAAPYIHQADDAAEVVGAEQIRRHEARQIGHRGIEHADVRRRAGHQVKAVAHAEEMRGGLAGHDGLQHAVPGLEKHVAFENRPCLERFLRSAIQRGAYFCQRIPIRIDPRTQADGRKRGEQTSQCLAICAGGLSELVERSGAVT